MESASSNLSASSATPLLDQISSPDDLRSFSEAQLIDLCDELRSELIKAISKIGGHFASSLGVVELTVALHRVFNTPHDCVVWDVGHQGYIHKMLTGRRHLLSTVRQKDGISGFLKRCESNYDCFGAGHAGTSISAATGICEASYHDYPGSEDRRVVAVIGDASIGNGMAFEALNHSGQLHRKLIVVLNDNEMSIAPNVGALSWFLSRAVTGKLSTSARRQFKNLVEKGVIPHTFYRALDKAEEAAQGFLSTPAMLFAGFGYRYIGPIDGHNLLSVIDTLERAKDQDGPVLVHALTVKGKGYAPAEQDPIKFHGVTPFDASCGKFAKSSKPAAKSYTTVYGEALVELAQTDPRVVAITAGMPDGTGLRKLAAELPDRFFDTGIAEEHAVTFAAGLASQGMRPFVSVYSTFLQRAYDQIAHDVCLQNLPVAFALDRGGLVGSDGPTHHGVFDLSYLRMLPNMVLMAPKDEAELRDMVFTAASYDGGPIAFRYPRGDGLGVALPPEPQLLEIGKAELLRRPRGNNWDVLLLPIGLTVQFALTAAEILSSDYGVEATVINPRFIKPLDEELLGKFIARHTLILTIEDNALIGGFGSAILEFMSDNGLTAERRLIRLGIEDRFIDHASQAQQYTETGIDTASIVARVREALGTPASISIESAAVA